VGTDAGKVVIEGNYLNNITLNNASEFVISDNRANSSNGHAGIFRIDTCENIIMSNNRLNGSALYADTLINITGNDFFWSDNWSGHLGPYITDVPYYYTATQNIHIRNSYNFNISGNKYDTYSYYNACGVMITSSSLGNISYDTIQRVTSI
jgi:hypothetical protein